jgi:general secretion pathway protein I
MRSHGDRPAGRTDPNAAGFTLLEVMIAVAVIAIAVVTLLGAQAQSVSIASGAKFDAMASLLAQWKMSDLMLQDFDQLAGDEGTFGEDYPHFVWKLKVEELTESETGLADADDMLKALDITVANDQDARLSFTLRTIVFKRPIAAAKPDGGKQETPGESKKKAETVDKSEVEP